MIGQQKRTLEHCVSFQPAKCMKQCGSFSCKEEFQACMDKDEVVDDAYDEIVEHSPRKPCRPEESSFYKDDVLDKDIRENNSSSQEQSSLELSGPFQESSASSPAPSRFFQMHVKSVPVGADFQADVPDWDPNMTACNPKEEQMWYGERVWPICDEDVECCSQTNVGKGRDEECSCSDRGSVDCVRKHVDEEKLRLMDDLGPAYDLCAFDEMGESVARHWTDVEQQTFREVVRQNPATMGKNFWHHLPVVFPSRTFREIVSYYFNVFVLRRRSIQNRVLPDEPDSDDDESYLPSRVSDWVAPREDWIPSDDEEDEYGGEYDDQQEQRPAEAVEYYDSGDDEEVGEVVEYVNGYGYDLNTSRSQAQIQDAMSHSFDDHKGELAESFMRSSDTELENMRRALPDSWLGPMDDWHHHHNSSSSCSASSCAAGNVALELASTNGALQEFFGSHHQYLVDDKKRDFF